MYYLRFQFLAKFICCTLLLFVSSPSFAKQQVAPPNPEREAAIKLLETGKNAEAVQAFRRYLGSPQNSKDSDALLYLGIAFYRNKEVGAAKESLEKSLKLNSQSELAHSTYATGLYAAGKFKKVEKEVIETLKLNVNNKDALYLRGVMSYNVGAYAKSFADADLVLQLDPEYAPAYRLKAQLLIVRLSTEGKDVFLEAANCIEHYLQLRASALDAPFWRERMITLRLYAEDKSVSGCEQATATVRPEVTHRDVVHYTEEARYSRITGTIRLRAIFDLDGKVKHILPLTYLDGGLTLEAIKVTQTIRFKPAKKGGVPVCVSMLLEYGFSNLN